MDLEFWIQRSLAILSGLIVIIPLVIQLVEYVKKAVKEKNWGMIVQLTLKYMTAAENMFENGAARKEWVIEMVKSSAAGIEYDLDEAAIIKISDLIDSICSAAKVINTPKEETNIINTTAGEKIKIDADKINILDNAR